MRSPNRKLGIASLEMSFKRSYSFSLTWAVDSLEFLVSDRSRSHIRIKTPVLGNTKDVFAYTISLANSDLGRVDKFQWLRGKLSRTAE